MRVPSVVRMGVGLTGCFAFIVAGVLLCLVEAQVLGLWAIAFVPLTACLAVIGIFALIEWSTEP